MLLEENQIAFHSEDGLIFDGVKDYSRQIAEMIGLGSDADFLQAGVSSVLIFLSLSLLYNIVQIQFLVSNVWAPLRFKNLAFFNAVL